MFTDFGESILMLCSLFWQFVIDLCFQKFVTNYLEKL